jgi:cold-inducible RNA-binding protein
LKIYVGNLSFDTNDSSLNAAFAAHGQVSSAEVVMDRETGRARGFGFVEMPNQEEANAAILALNGSSLQGRELNVNQAKDRTDRAPSGNSYAGGGNRR